MDNFFKKYVRKLATCVIIRTWTLLIYNFFLILITLVYSGESVTDFSYTNFTVSYIQMHWTDITMMHWTIGHGSFEGQDQICPNFRQSPLKPRSSAVGARIEAPKALTGVGCGEGVSPSPRGRGLGRGCAPSPEIFSIFEVKKASFGAPLVLYFAVD